MIRAALVTGALLLAVDARAQNAAPLIGTSHALPVVPLVKLEGSASGKATMTLSLDYIFGPSRETDIRISPTFQTTTSEGVATLLSANSNAMTAGAAWQLGVTVTFTGLPSLTGIPHEVATPAQRLEAANVCIDACTAADTSEICKNFRDEREKAREQRGVADLEKEAARLEKIASEAPAAAPDTVGKLLAAKAAKDKAEEANRAAVVHARHETADTVSAHLFCPKGAATLAKIDTVSRDQALLYPSRIISVGVLLGESRFKYLGPAADPALLTPASTSKPKLSFGLTYVRLPYEGPITIELPVRMDMSWESASRTARWCRPAGSVVRPDGSGSDPAEICDEQALGAPKRNMSVRGAFQFGYIHKQSGTWRLAVGPAAKYSVVTSGDNTYEVGLEAPLYLSMPLAKNGYQGLIRVAPSMMITHANDGTDDSRFLLTVALLGDRSMFVGALQ